MESLAAMVAVLLLITMFSGPLCLVLATERVKDWSHRWVALFWFRRFVVISLAIIGATVAVNFMFAPNMSVGRLVGLFGAISIAMAMKWEFKPKAD